jgi:hypothetical protein
MMVDVMGVMPVRPPPVESRTKQIRRATEKKDAPDHEEPDGGRVRAWIAGEIPEIREEHPDQQKDYGENERNRPIHPTMLFMIVPIHPTI